MPNGKPAGVRCAQLTADNRCRLFGKPERPAVCVRLRPAEEMCGSNAETAHRRLALLELATLPDSARGEWEGLPSQISNGPTA